MSNIEICPDDHKCENGSICVENPTAEGKYYCDCDEVNDYETVYSGLSCQHRATVYCTLTGEMSRTTFCTNEGTCKAIVDINEDHIGCDCPFGYEGLHCQFVQGSKPDGWPIHAPSSKSDVVAHAVQGSSSSNTGGGGTNSSAGAEGLAAGSIAAIVLSLVALVGILLFIIWRRVGGRHVYNTHIVDPTKSSGGHLHNADGGNIVQQVRNTTTPTFDSDVYMTDSTFDPNNSNRHNHPHGHGPSSLGHGGHDNNDHRDSEAGPEFT